MTVPEPVASVLASLSPLLDTEIERDERHARAVGHGRNDGLADSVSTDSDRLFHVDFLGGVERAVRQRDVAQERAQRKRRHDGGRNQSYPVLSLRQGCLKGVQQFADGLPGEVERRGRKLLPLVDGFQPCA